MVSLGISLPVQKMEVNYDCFTGWSEGLNEYKKIMYVNKQIKCH